MLYTGASQTFQLPDGRLLGFTQYGPTDGDPVFYFHGLFGTRIEAESSQRSTRRTDTRLIAVDRPGYGLSSFAPGRQLYNWPDDIAALADSLGIRKFSLLAVSTGGPYALACAHKMPHRIRRIGIAGSLAPLMETGLLRHMHWLPRACVNQAQQGGTLGQVFLGGLLGLLARLSPRNLMQRLVSTAALRPQSRPTGPSDFFTSLREGFAGPYFDLSLVAKEWGFEIGEITLPVCIWHGQDDYAVPMAMSRYLLEHIPYSQACFVRGEGHFSILNKHINTALLQLKAG